MVGEGFWKHHDSLPYSLKPFKVIYSIFGVLPNMGTWISNISWGFKVIFVEHLLLMMKYIKLMDKASIHPFNPPQAPKRTVT